MLACHKAIHPISDDIKSVRRRLALEAKGFDDALAAAIAGAMSGHLSPLWNACAIPVVTVTRKHPAGAPSQEQ
jgi:hypothetical protein